MCFPLPILRCAFCVLHVTQTHGFPLRRCRHALSIHYLLGIWIPPVMGDHGLDALAWLDELIWIIFPSRPLDDGTIVNSSRAGSLNCKCFQRCEPRHAPMLHVCERSIERRKQWNKFWNTIFRQRQTCDAYSPEPQPRQPLVR